MSKTRGAVVPVQRIFDMSIGNSGQPDVCLFDKWSIYGAMKDRISFQKNKKALYSYYNAFLFLISYG